MNARVEHHLPLIILAALVLASVVILPAPAAAQETTYAPAGEVMSRGSSSGFENMGLDDARTNVKTEGGTTRTGTAWLKPDADSTPLQWAPVGCADHYACLTDDPVQDGNATRIAVESFEVNLVDRHTIANLSAEAVTIDSVTMFSWARREVGASGYIFYLDDGASCAQYAPVVTLAYANYSQTSPLACAGGSWTAALVNALTLSHIGPQVGAAALSVTAAGVVVEYTYRDDYYVDVTYSFERLEGRDFRLRWECTTTDDEGLAVYINSIMYAGGGLCAGANATGTLQFDWGGGDITVRLVSPSTTGDITESAYTFDFLLIEGTPTDAGTGVRYTFDCLHLSPLIGMWCTDRSTYLPGQSVVRIEWYVQGVKKAETAKGGTAWLPTPEGWMSWGATTVVVGMRVVFGNQGESGPLVLKALTIHNWPRAVVTFAVPILVAALAYKRRYRLR